MSTRTIGGPIHARSASLLLLVTLAVAFMMTSAPAWAQKGGDSNTRSLSGEVIDKSGAPIPKSVVYLKNTKTLQMRTYIADDSGNFHFQGLSSNNDYEVHAEADGASSPVRVISGFDSRKEVNISLKIDKK